MLKQSLIGAALVLSTSAVLAGDDFGSVQQAKAMLERAVTAIKADKSAAIDRFNHNDASFRDRDLFVFCFNAGDGVLTAHEAMVARDVRSLRDVSGKSFGEEMYRSAREADVVEVAYASPLPGSTQRAQKRAFLTRVADQVCGVSVYWFGQAVAPTL